MKIAVLLTGQLRTWEMLKYLHLNSLILPYNADLFLGIDLNNKYQCLHKNSNMETTLDEANKAIDFFKPINSFILNDVNNSFISNNVKNKNFILLFRQYYVVKKTYEMVKKYSDSNNIKYDIIVRLRFDQLIWCNEVSMLPNIYDNELRTVLYNQDNIDKFKNYSNYKKFIFEEVNDNTIYVFGFGDIKHYKYANDQFFYHNHTLLEKVMNFYDNIDNIMTYCIKNNIGQNGGFIECVFYLYFTQSNVILKKSNISGIFVRQNI